MLPTLPTRRGLPSCVRCIHQDGQIFTPPYLLNGDGTNATRPTLSATSTTFRVGGTITATTNETISMFSLIRRGCASCGVLQLQRAKHCSGLAASGAEVQYSYMEAVMRLVPDVGSCFPALTYEAQSG